VRGVRVLVTNDDGIDSPGLTALARCAVDHGWQVIVAAPATQASGTGAGLLATRENGRVAADRRSLPDLPGVEAYAVASHPALIALLACHGGFGPPPDVVLSGVNLGANLGRAVLHSGTVGAALTAGINGARALAASIDSDVEVGPDGLLADDENPHWDTASAVVARLLPTVAALETGSVVNVNVPNTPDPPATRWARLSTYGLVRQRVRRWSDGGIEVGVVRIDGELEPGTDAALLAEGYATVTPLRSVGEAEDLLGGPLPE
jgi:5'-nucleotidase